ncbi:MAG: MotA/TolQ/ExbB proton channel family protein [Lachnospiraceae bacterium]|nr:MotA/TolQ/ExbB proton channel family protein [Lachnospiraceae bacterium]
MKSFGSEGILLPVYFIMLGVAAYLNFFSGSKVDMVNVLINICMFLIVGGIILWANTHCFMPINRMMSSLHLASRNFKTDFDKKRDYLWDDYKNNAKLFNNKLADKRFYEYCQEKKRLDMLNRSSQCDIDDYLNEYYIDAIMKRGLVSIVPGVMTGLGILGTFVGLSFGLQNFHTENAAAITNSIAPLMDGIKIAFHTSIYGMVFSLIFNFVYKKNLEDAYMAMDEFLESYHKYVAPKPENNTTGLLLEYQTLQMMQMEELLDKFGDDLAEKIAKALR